MTTPAAAPAPGSDPGGEQAVETVARLWIGRFDNARQVQASLARGGPAVPELTREHRSLEVVRLEATQLGPVVLYLQECRASVPLRAHRQRVLRLRPDEAGEGVVAEQLFFRDGPTYDRPLLSADQVAGLGEEAFTRYPGCDLLIHFEPEHNRWRGAMRPGACRYHHPVDGEVCAEFAMLLSEGQHWYRDRSLRLSDGSIRGEVDGFSWLLFDRLAPDDTSTLPVLGLPSLAEQMGVWEGIFRRYDAEGGLQESFAITVVQRLEARDGRWLYSQKSLYRETASGSRWIETSGEILGGRLHFQSDRVRGWAMDVPDAPGTTLLVLESLDGSGLQMQEVSQLVDGGSRRLRTTQIFREGRLVGRTHIDEQKTSQDPLTWTPPAPAEA
jgi:hypothetical protein